MYDYRCENCGKFEKVQKITEEPLSECPVCGGPVHRLISKNVGIVLKGSGFYKTDSGNSLKDRARKVNHERQKDNQALLDSDVSGYVAQAETTDKKIAEV
ncbi:MAG TPA: zinc ribbon domain-containing protein [Syntrophomonadaceae bacterium]|nr:zinc ribbon domain-containing protein [Syntrophomonadaceae bacterium]HPR93380.1 zinc ribbon domain-containing protein [Syntrophomonadaceae bacterium]